MLRPIVAARHNDKGVILIVSLWILAILSLFAIGLGHKLSLQIRLLHNRLDGIKAYYIAKAGVERAIAEREKALLVNEVIYADSFSQAWLANTAVFKQSELGDGVFTVENQDVPGAYGLSDEQAKININTASFDTLKALLKQVSLSDEAASGLTAGIIDWRNKNSRFDTIEEILSVKDMTPDIFYGRDANISGIKKYITVYGSGVVNINTAPAAVLTAILDPGSVRPELISYITDARKSLLDKNESGTWFVSIAPDDLDAQGYLNKNSASIKNISSDNLDLNDQERLLLAVLKAAHEQGLINVTSSVFKINSAADVRGIGRSIEAVIEFDDKNPSQYKFISWNQK